MNKKLTLLAASFLGAVTLYAQEPCRDVHGRAQFYSGDGQLRIWHIGTHHTFAIYDEASTDLLMQYLELPHGGSKTMYADFTVCPTAKFREGAAQPAVVRKVRNKRFGRPI